MAYISIVDESNKKKESVSLEKTELQKKQIKTALNHPVRSKILKTLESGDILTQHEIGNRLSMSNASIHYHINKLLEVQLVELNSTRPGPNGIVEKLYKVKEENWNELKKAKIEDFDVELNYSVAWINERLREGTNILKKQKKKTTFVTNSYSVNASQEDIRALKQQVMKVCEDFFQKHKDVNSEGNTPVSVSFSILPSHGDDIDDSFISFESD